MFAANVLSAYRAFRNITPANMVHTKSCVNRNLFLIGCEPSQQCTDATSLFLVSCLLCPVRQDILSKTKSLALMQNTDIVLIVCFKIYDSCSQEMLCAVSFMRQKYC